MTKKMRGFTKDGWVRVQRTVLRRVVGDRLQALLRGDFYVRNHLGEEDYDPILKEVAALNVPTPPQNGGLRQAVGANGSNAPQEQPQSPPDPPQKFTPELETFIQLIAASIMIDASMRGENAGESDTRFIKKKKKLLAKTLQGPKLGVFQKEVLRFDIIKRGEDYEEEEIVESEESRSSESESESESDEGGLEAEKKKKKIKKAPLKLPMSPPTHMPPQREDSGGESSSDDEEDHDSTVSDTCTSNTSLSQSQDGFSTSATSSKHPKKKDKKRLKKERKKEKKRMKKVKRRKEKEEKRRRKRKLEKEKMKAAKHAAKKRKKHHGNEDAALSLADNELSDTANGGDADESMDIDNDHYGVPEEAPIYEIATKADFEKYKDDLLSRVPKSVKSRFREGAFSRWGKDWLPVLELGPFDVEPGPVRDMWLEMFDNTQENGRDMTRLVFWYGVKFEDRGQAYSFVPETKLTPYDEGERKGYCKMPKKIQKKVEKKQKLTKTEEQIKRGLKEIVGDMQHDKPDRAAWMMNFKEDYELAEEDAAKEEAESKLRSASVGEEEDGEQQEVAMPKKRKPGRPKKEESVAMAALDKPIKRKPGRPKKVVDVQPPDEDSVVKVKKKPGRPKKSEKEKAEKAAAKAVEKAAAKASEKAAARAAEKAAAKAKKSAAKKWVIVDEDQESDMDTEDEGDGDDNDYDFGVDSDDDGDMNVEGNSDSDAEKPKKRKAEESPDKKPKKKSKSAMTEEEKAVERRAKAAGYREKKAREKAEAQGLEYVKGRVGRKSKQTMLDEEQLKFTKCEEVFLPMMDRLTEAKDASNVKVVLKYINSITDRVELLTPPFLREYPLGMLMKTVRKSFEGVHPEVKEKCKHLTAEMKRVYTEKEKKIPEGFDPVKNKKSTPELDQEEAQVDDKQESDCPALDSVKSENFAIKSEKIAIKSENVVVKLEKIAIKPEKVVVKSEKIAIKTDKTALRAEKVEISVEQSIPKRNSEMSLSEPLPRKMVGANSSECLPDATKSEPPPAPKQKKTFSIMGMFAKPKPTPKPKIAAPVPNMVFSGQPLPKPKSLPSWVTGPAVKMEGFHEQHAKERTLGLEFLVDAASLVTSSSAKKFDPVSVSHSFELAIFAETKLRGRDWQQYWEKVHDVVALLSPGKNKCNAILQGIISGDYQEPSELVKLSRREIQSLNQLKS